MIKPKPLKPKFLANFYSTTKGKILHWIILLFVILFVFPIILSIGEDIKDIKVVKYIIGIIALILIIFVVFGSSWVWECYYPFKKQEKEFNEHQQVLPHKRIELEQIKAEQQRILSDVSKILKPGLLEYEHSHPGILATIGLNVS